MVARGIQNIYSSLETMYRFGASTIPSSTLEQKKNPGQGSAMSGSCVSRALCVSLCTGLPCACLMRGFWHGDWGQVDPRVFDTKIHVV